MKAQRYALRCNHDYDPPAHQIVDTTTGYGVKNYPSHAAAVRALRHLRADQERQP